MRGMIVWGLMLTGAAALAAQAPLLSVQAEHGPRGWVALITNNHNAAVTSFVLRMTYWRDGQGPFRALHWEDAVPGPVVSRMALAPGATRSLRMGGPGFTSVSYENVAVIYADGATAGDSAFVSHIIRARQLELADLREVMPLLARAATDPSSTRASLADAFAPRVATGKRALEDHVLPPADRVCQTVMINLQQPPDASMPLTRQLQDISRVFARWQAQLVASRPALDN